MELVWEGMGKLWREEGWAEGNRVGKGKGCWMVKWTQMDGWMDRTLEG